MSALHVVILAAGKGSRLGALGAQKPKWLLDVGDRTIADHQLEGLERASGTVASVRVVTGHAREAIDRFLEAGRDVQVVHNIEYARLNNWYSVLLALRSITDPDPRVAIINGDLFARADWIAKFLVDSTGTSSESLIAVDTQRPVTDESMKVAMDGASRLSAIGKEGIVNPVGEYVGMLMAAGSVLEDFRTALERFERQPESANEWYESAVGVSAAAGTDWTVWPTPDSHWVEIDDDADHSIALRMSESL